MAKKARQRVSYVLPLANSPGGHRLGVNGLAVDRDQSILYSGGRDGAICAWDLNLNLNDSDQSPDDDLDDPFADPEDPPSETSTKKLPLRTTFRAQTQAHTHWVNDIVLAQNNAALVSASSDLTVRVWRPQSDDDTEAPAAIGQHADFVKCLAVPSVNTDWVASGGLDRKICLWDLNGAGRTLEIDVGHEELNSSEKGSIYALGVSRSIMASGGPESIVRLWDPRSGKRITKFLGHTDNIRSILVNESGDTVMTASSDQTVKVWSVTAGRCMHTLTMHNDSVWSLYSEDPHLGVFYSADRAGLIVKTDTRGTLDLDDGLSIAIAQEHEGVNKVLVAGDYIWTTTLSSSINRWSNINTGIDAQLPELYHQHRRSSVVSESLDSDANERTRREIPLRSILKISNTASIPGGITREHDKASSHQHARKVSEVIIDPDLGVVESIQNLPQETIEGQHGLVKHKLLNNRRQVLTLDTAGDVLLWDLLHCVPIKSFGKRHLEDVEPEVNTMEAIAPWCSIDTRTGRLAVVLEEYNCFDGEMYADELQLEEKIDFRDDQRINLGKWVLRYIFSALIDEMIKRDEVYRKELQEDVKAAAANKHKGMTIQIPSAGINSWKDAQADGQTTPRATTMNYPTTPGFGIGVATPGATLMAVDEGNTLEKRTTRVSSDGYFSSNAASNVEASAGATENGVKSPGDGEKSKFGNRLMKGMGFKKNLAKTVAAAANMPVAEKPAPVVEDIKEDVSETSETSEKEIDDSFLGALQKIRAQYDKQLLEKPDRPLDSGITPSLTNETPVLKPPYLTTVIIQEDTSGGYADLYRGTVGAVGKDASLIEKRAPMWLGDVLLRNHIPLREPVKVSFILQPFQDELPSIAGPDGNCRLNANRMLRVKKILTYVAERIEPSPPFSTDPSAMQPQEYLELYCYDQRLPTGLTLATLRAHVWKGGPDVMLYYKSNGRRDIPGLKKKRRPTDEAGVDAAGSG